MLGEATSPCFGTNGGRVDGLLALCAVQGRREKQDEGKTRICFCGYEGMTSSVSGTSRRPLVLPASQLTAPVSSVSRPLPPPPDPRDLLLTTTISPRRNAAAGAYPRRRASRGTLLQQRLPGRRVRGRRHLLLGRLRHVRRVRGGVRRRHRLLRAGHPRRRRVLLGRGRRRGPVHHVKAHGGVACVIIVAPVSARVFGRRAAAWLVPAGGAGVHL